MFGKFFRAAVFTVAAFTGFFVLFSFFAPWYPMADSVAHFRFHLTAVMLLATVMLAVVRDWRFAGVALAVSLAGVAGLTVAFPYRDNTASAGETPPIVAVQLNLSFRNTAPEAVAAFIRREHADVVTLQEVTRKTGRVMELLKEDYPSQVLCPFSGVGGVAVLSRLPKAPGGAQGCVEGKGMAWMRVMAGGRPVSVASLHLHWPYPFRQGDQIGRLEKYLKRIPRPVILAGDFNSAPWSHAVDRIAGATDTTVTGGLRFSFDIRFSSWTPPIAMPIDHILLPDGIVPLDVRLGPGPGSDHLSIVAKLALPASPVPAQALAPASREVAVAN